MATGSRSNKQLLSYVVMKYSYINITNNFNAIRDTHQDCEIKLIQKQHLTTFINFIMQCFVQLFSIEHLGQGSLYETNPNFMHISFHALFFGSKSMKITCATFVFIKFYSPKNRFVQNLMMPLQSQQQTNSVFLRRFFLANLISTPCVWDRKVLPHRRVRNFQCPQLWRNRNSGY